ncbi:hypothetical protein H0H92_002065, partial [Tricholoma furcatifolium]
RIESRVSSTPPDVVEGLDEKRRSGEKLLVARSVKERTGRSAGKTPVIRPMVGKPSSRMDGLNAVMRSMVCSGPSFTTLAPST